MTFEERLRSAAHDVEARLGRLLDDAAAHATGVPLRLGHAMSHAATSGGKRLRPFLVLETAALFGAPAARAMPAALALELIHCYSLVHDDLPAMDNDELRRGRPTVWKAYDEWTAILAGDGLLTLAFEVLADPASKVPPQAVVVLVRELAEASGRAGMVGGQCLDLEAGKLGRPPRHTETSIATLQAMKTGALFRYACRAGAIVGGAGAAELAALTDYAEALGAAFQLADDLLDAEGDAATLGKATAKDAAAGKATLVGLLGLDGARERLGELETRGIAALAPLGPRADTLRETLRFAVNRKH